MALFQNRVVERAPLEKLQRGRGRSVKIESLGWIKIKEIKTARSPLYQRRFLRPNTHFAAFFEIYKIQKPLHRSKRKILKNFDDSFLRICQILTKFSFNFQVENL